MIKYKNFRNVKVLVDGTITATVDEVSTKPVEVYLKGYYPVAKMENSRWRYIDTGKRTKGNKIENMYNIYND